MPATPKFQNAFGKPPEPAKGPAMGLLPKPQIASAPTAPARTHAAQPRHIPVVAHGEHVSGRLAHPVVAQGQAAGPAQVLSYHNNQGYTPGAFLPNFGGSNSSGSDANVHGKIIAHH
jgi:hypothetical protein